MTRRDRVTVNLIPSDADWLRRHADEHGVTLSVALQTLIGAARVDEEREEERIRRRVKREANLDRVVSLVGTQLVLALFEGAMH